MADKTTHYDFQTLVDRRGSSSYKWDDALRRTGRENLLPFWVADMDFPVAPPIRDALQARLDHGVFGYSFRPESLDDALISWFAAHHSWVIRRGDLLEIPGIVPFLHILVQTLTRPGDSVIIQEPVYYPFRLALERNGRTIADNPLVRFENNRWRMDMDGLAASIEKNAPKLLILCNPHNPVGRAWLRDELIELAELCRDNGICVISDEIHADITLPGFTHTPWLTLPASSLPESIALVSATKSFNIPALNMAFAVVPDKRLRRLSSDALNALGMGGGISSALAYVASEAAWREGRGWLEAFLSQLTENDLFLRSFLSEKLPEARPGSLEATYLEWIDLSRLGLDDNRIYDNLLDSGVWLSRGDQFGRGGERHVRMNIACPRSRLEEGLTLMVQALS